MSLKYNEWLPENFPRFDLCFASDEFILINIPKNASSSMKKALKSSSKINRLSFFKCQKANTKTCIVIRDPNTRIVSSFSELLKRRRDGPHWETSECQWFKIYQQNPEKNIRKSFKLFLDYIETRLYDSHLHTQTSYLDGKNLSLEDIDHVLMFENLNKDFKKMNEETGGSYRIDWSNRTTKLNQKSILNDLINHDETIENQIKSIYAEDFILYDKARG